MSLVPRQGTSFLAKRKEAKIRFKGDSDSPFEAPVIHLFLKVFHRTLRSNERQVLLKPKFFLRLLQPPKRF